MKFKRVWKSIKVQMTVLLLVGTFSPLNGQAGEIQSVVAKDSVTATASAAKKEKRGFHTARNGKVYYVNAKGQRIRGLRKFGSNYYYFGNDTYLAKNRWINISGRRYRANEKGILQSGFWTSSRGNTYYFDQKCVEKRGWQKIKSAYYFFDVSTGLMAKGKSVDGIYLNRKTGKAQVTTKNRKYLEVYVTAQKVVEQVTTPNMTRSQKLRKCFEYVVSKPYITRRYPFQSYDGWEVDYANDTFLLGGGTCFSDGSSFAFLAHALGYSEVYSCSSYGHGWTVINGWVYDPLVFEDKKSEYYYGGFRENENGFRAAVKAKIGD